MRGHAFNWAGVDWSLQNRDIAEQLGRSNATVSQARKRLGKPRPKLWHTPKDHLVKLAQWKRVDWRLPNCVIAESQGVSNERVRHVRKAIGAPRAVLHYANRKTVKLLEWITANADGLRGLTLAQLRQRLGHRLTRGSRVRLFLKERVGIERAARFEHPWRLMNFELPSAELERIWQLPHNSAANRRTAKRIRPPKWRVEPGKSAANGTPTTPAYVTAIRREEEKARKYYATTQAPRQRTSPSGSRLARIG